MFKNVVFTTSLLTLQGLDPLPRGKGTPKHSI